MERLYAYVAKDSDDVQREWVRYTQRIDAILEAALKTAVRTSLQQLSKCLSGERRKEVPMDGDRPPATPPLWLSLGVPDLLRDDDPRHESARRAPADYTVTL